MADDDWQNQPENPQARFRDCREPRPVEHKSENPQAYHLDERE